MVERLSEEERKIINQNWNSIKEKVLMYSSAEINVEELNLNIKAEKDNDDIILAIEKKDEATILISVSINAKIMTFKYQNEDKKIEKQELIYESSSIIYFVNHFKMQHPIFKKKEENEILNKSVNEENAEEIFDNPEINEIIDDRFESYISKEDFFKFKKAQEEISDYYDQYSLKGYKTIAELITQKTKKKILGSEGRNNLIKFLENLYMIKEKIIVLAGSQKIGITFSLLKIVKYYSILYLDINTLYKLEKSEKRKYIFNRIINLFRDYDKYYKFVNDNILTLQGYDNILLIFEEIISKISKKSGKIIIIVDNYDDNFVGEKKLSSEFLDKIYSIIQDTSTKILFIGRGNFISNLLIDFFYNKSNIKKYIYFKYFTTLVLNIENIIHDYYKENKMNEIDLYYKENKENNIESIIPNLIIIKNMSNIIGENFRSNFPFHFFHFSQDQNKNLKIEYQFNDLLDLNNIKLREYMAKLNNITLCYEKTSPSVKGFLFEELVVSILMNNKSGFKNLNFPQNNIIEVESIYDMKNINTINNLENGPILIIQQKNGEVFDFGIIIDYNGLNCFIGGQIGLNKTNKEISEYQQKIYLSHNIILNNLKILTGRIIKELKFIIILNKEWQKNLKEEYDKKYKKIIKYDKKINEKKQPTAFEKEESKKMKKEMSYFNSQYGMKCCENWNISYLLFSDKDLCFYKDDKKIESFNFNEIKSFQTGFELFCIKEYNLIPYTINDPILSEKEKSQFLNKLKEMYSDVKDIKINFKINGKINLLPATPENYGILSVYNDIKIFTYYDGKFSIFVFKDDKVSKFDNFENINNNSFENDEYLERYFIELIYDDEDEINIKEETDKNEKGKENFGIEIDEEKENNKIFEEDKPLKKKVNQIKKQQKNNTYLNHFKYLQNKRLRDNKEN